MSFEITPRIEEIAARPREEWGLEEWKEWAIFQESAAASFRDDSLYLLKQLLSGYKPKRPVGRPRANKGGLVGGLLGYFDPPNEPQKPRPRGRARKYNENIELWHKAIVSVKKQKPSSSRREIIKTILLAVEGNAELDKIEYLQRRLSDYKKILDKSQKPITTPPASHVTAEDRSGVTIRTHHGQKY